MTDYIPASLLADLQTNVYPMLYRDVVSIYSISSAIDEYANETRTRTLKTTTTGLLSSPNGSERRLITQFANNGLQNIRLLKLTLPFGTDISANDEVTIAGEATPSGAWNVLWTNSAVTLSAATEVYLSQTSVNSEVQP